MAIVQASSIDFSFIGVSSPTFPPGAPDAAQSFAQRLWFDPHIPLLLPRLKNV
jgi:hypothetical protein